MGIFVRSASIHNAICSWPFCRCQDKKYKGNKQLVKLTNYLLFLKETVHCLGDVGGVNGIVVRIGPVITLLDQS
jgi:hypothetical protein